MPRKHAEVDLPIGVKLLTKKCRVTFFGNKLLNNGETFIEYHEPQDKWPQTLVVPIEQKFMVSEMGKPLSYVEHQTDMYELEDNWPVRYRWVGRKNA